MKNLWPWGFECDPIPYSVKLASTVYYLSPLHERHWAKGWGPEPAFRLCGSVGFRLCVCVYCKVFSYQILLCKSYKVSQKVVALLWTLTTMAWAKLQRVRRSRQKWFSWISNQVWHHRKTSGAIGWPACPSFPRTSLVLGLKIPYPMKALSSRQNGVVMAPTWGGLFSPSQSERISEWPSPGLSLSLACREAFQPALHD